MTLAEREKLLVPTQKHSLRRQKSGKVGGAFSASFKLTGGDGDDAPDFQTQLKKALSSNMKRVLDLFRDWDDDASGTVDKKEFRRAVTALGLEAPRIEIDRLFDSFDKDGGGEIDCACTAAHSPRVGNSRPTPYSRAR